MHTLLDGDTPEEEEEKKLSSLGHEEEELKKDVDVVDGGVGGGAKESTLGEKIQTLYTRVWSKSDEDKKVEEKEEKQETGLLSLFGSVAKSLESAVAVVRMPAEPPSPSGPVNPPWHVEDSQADKMGVLRAQILNLSHEKWTFMQIPAEEALTGFSFEMSSAWPLAAECLRLDPQLEKMRWVLVPWKVKEEAFWRNYFAHIYAVREAILGSRIEKEAAERAVSSEMTGKRNLDDLLLFATDESDGIASSSFEKSGGATGEDVIELSSLSMEGLSLEEQINAALRDEL